MATMNISQHDSVSYWVEVQAGSGRYANASDFVRDLIRRDQGRAGKIAELQRLIDADLASGVSERAPEEVRQLRRDRLTFLQAERYTAT